MRLTEEQARNLFAQRGQDLPDVPSGSVIPAPPHFRPHRSEGQVELPAPQHEPTRQNDTELAYELEVLAPGKVAGSVLDYVFEGVSLRLGHNCFYRLDYFVVTPVRFEVHEVKGHWRDDARVKIKTAAQRFPYFHFVAVTKVPKKDGGGWRYEHFPVH